jgi:hypothetical protein
LTTLGSADFWVQEEKLTRAARIKKVFNIGGTYHR